MKSVDITEMMKDVTAVVPLDVTALEKIAVKLHGVTVKSQYMKVVIPPVRVRARRCKRNCGKLYRDWYDEWVCPTCGYHEYND